MCQTLHWIFQKHVPVNGHMDPEKQSYHCAHLSYKGTEACLRFPSRELAKGHTLHPDPSGPLSSVTSLLQRDGRRKKIA